MRQSRPSKILSWVLTIWLATFGSVRASFGDQSHIFMACIHHCYFSNCSTDSDVIRFELDQPWHLLTLGWDCESECGHQCMWQTVDYFQSFSEKLQFRGKWPFVRLFGIQEPASAIFSLLNLVTHVYGWNEFTKRISPRNRYYTLWRVQAYLAMNAWLWSTVFHTRDLQFTESMDYFCAFSIVLYSLYAIVARVLIEKSELLVNCCRAVFAIFLVYHIHYMSNINFDYQYHLGLSIGIGILNSVLWLWWAWCHRERRYVSKCAFVVCAILVSSLFEILDFSPIWFVFDAHSLWHLATAPLPLVWYRFLIDDCRFESTKVREPYLRPTFARKGLAHLKELLKELSVLHIKEDAFVLE